MTSLPAGAGRRCHAPLNRLHATLYFSPDTARELERLGVDDPRAQYFAGRAAPLGAVGAATVTATFYNFNPELVARHIPRVWRTAGPEAVLLARQRAADATLRRLLGEKAASSPEVAEAADLAVRAAEGCTAHARPLYAAHAELPVPEEPHLRLWHAATLLREHRGDGHLAILLRERLDPLEAVVTHTATGRGMSPTWVLTTRGWTPEDWQAAQERLRARGLLTANGELTEDGTALREEIEHETDRLDDAPYDRLGATDVARLTTLADGFAETAVKAGAFPADLFGTG